MLIGIVGLNGSGKETVAEYLVRHYGFEHRDLGQGIRDELKMRGRDHLSRDEMRLLANEMRSKLGFSYWCKKAIDSIKSRDLVITSLRNPAEVEEIKKRNGIVVEVFADQETRFERTIARVKGDSKKHGDIKSLEDFEEKESKELRNKDPSKQQLIKCIEMAGYRLDNNGTKLYLNKQIEELLRKLNYPQERTL